MEPQRTEPPQKPGPRDRERRGKVVRRAFFKPLNLLTLVAGLGIFFTTDGQLWLLPLTLVVYAVVVYLAANDPVFAERVTGGRSPSSPALPSRDVSPERRSRWLPRGEARQKVESALVTYRKVLVAIEESDDVTTRVLEGAVPKLHEAANRLVDVASNRERAARTLADFDADEPSAAHEDRQRQDSLRSLRDHVKQADKEIDEISNQFLTLRAQVVRVSMDSAGASQQSEMINESLDGLNYRLEALNETFTGEAP